MFQELLGSDVVDLQKLRSRSWSGIPSESRAVRPAAPPSASVPAAALHPPWRTWQMCWQLLLGYLPPNLDWRESTLQRKRKDYYGSVPQVPRRAG